VARVAQYSVSLVLPEVAAHPYRAAPLRVKGRFEPGGTPPSPRQLLRFLAGALNAMSQNHGDRVLEVHVLALAAGDGDGLARDADG
jgi:hypothetical protein